MMNLLESFAGGLCFAFGAAVGILTCSLFGKASREAYAKESQLISKKIEDRMAVQIGTMAACLDEIKKNKTKTK